MNVEDARAALERTIRHYQVGDELMERIQVYALAIHVEVCKPCERRRMIKGKSVYCAKAEALRL